jgi:ornithine carbamoyltransferase
MMNVAGRLSGSPLKMGLQGLGKRSMSIQHHKNLMCISQLSNSELSGLLQHSLDMKKAWYNTPDVARKTKPLEGYSMSMIFQKRSTRTRVSSETGMFMLGGHGLMLGPQDIQLGVNESMKDTSNVLSRFNDIILARVFGHEDVVELEKYSTKPVINALSDKYHPLQTLADLMTLHEHWDGNFKGKTLGWVGDGNNIIHDFMIGAIKQGMNVQVATPTGYECDADVMETAKQLAVENGVSLTFTTDPMVASKGADVISTDTWVSMGEESQAAQKKKDFAGYQVNDNMMANAAPGCVFLHCLPRKPEECTDEVFYSPASLVFPEAENRLWTVMAVTMELLGKRWGQ